MSQHAIEPTALHDLGSESGAGLRIIDVRERDEFEALRAPQSVLHPLSALSRGDLGPLAAVPRTETIYLICRSGARSARACDLLAAAGFTSPVNVTGGMIAWEKAGLPVVRGAPR